MATGHGSQDFKDCYSKFDIAKLFEILDEKSRVILWHLWWYRHTEISDLRAILDPSSDFEVLYRLKDVINAEAQRLWGRPIVEFKQSKIDPFTGEIVLFNWWFLDEDNISQLDKNKPFVDIFDEKNYVTIIAQYPNSINLIKPDIQVKNGFLRIQLKKNGIEGDVYDSERT